MENNQTNLMALRQNKEIQNQVTIGFDTESGFNLLEKAAKRFSQSPFVPESYRGENGLGACVVAVDMAIRMKAAPLMVMQNLYLIDGKPGWSAQWCIAQVNNCGRFSPLEYEIIDYGEQEFEYVAVDWVNNSRQYNKKKVILQNIGCTAFATELRTGKIIRGVEVTMEMAVKEGWYGKKSSKWQTMEPIMLRYRAASFFCKLYAPELLMGLQTAEELQDIIDITPQGEVINQTTERLKRKTKNVTSNVKENEKEIITDLETGEIINNSVQNTMSSEELNQSMAIIEELCFLRKSKATIIEQKFPNDKLKSFDNEIDNFFEGVSLQDLINKRDFIQSL